MATRQEAHVRRGNDEFDLELVVAAPWASVRGQLKLLEAETDQTSQQPLSEALNDLFVKRRKDPIA